MPWVILCRGSFCAVGRFELGPFCALGCFELDPLCAYVVSWVVLSLGRFMMGRFVCAPDFFGKNASIYSMNSMQAENQSLKIIHCKNIKLKIAIKNLFTAKNVCLSNFFCLSIIKPLRIINLT